MEYMKLKIIRGRNVTDLDLKKGKRVCLVSDTMTSYYFGDEDPIGQQIVFNSEDGKSYEFTIVGVYEYNAAVFGKQDTSVPEKDRTTQMYIPVTTVTNLSEDESGYSYVTILLQTGADATLAQSEVDEFFSEKYEDNENWHIYTYNMSSDMGMINTVINVITIAIAFIAAISLIVGGVGVMNIMLVSITERTREIGIRKALGAKNKTIRQQFLIESVVLCLIGGVIGILLGLLFGFLLGKVAMVLINTYYADYSSYIIMNVRPSGIAILISVCVSMLIGIFFGSYPAKKAAKMEVIDALRYE
jgi:putative ABC transport system permease protein